LKNILFTTILGVVLYGCGSAGEDDGLPSAPAVENKAPSTPTLSAPNNNLLCIDNEITFQWNASTDPESNAISYEIQIATDNQFGQNLQTNSSSSTSTTVTLDKGVAYYWRVKAHDTKNASSSYSSIFSFYTEGVGDSNHLPFSPTLVAPVLNAIEQHATTNLEWTASDVDNDSLLYDIYFGTENPPTIKVSDNQSETTLNVNLTASANYFWKVIVKDDKGGKTIGQVWNFDTD